MEPTLSPFPNRETHIRETHYRAVQLRRALAADDVQRLGELFMTCSDLQVQGAGQMLKAIADGLLRREDTNG